ncbi:MAG: PorT family protein [Bacteroidales bacterium]|nr:PorT family protein [Bacteroidales bacterium]
MADQFDTFDKVIRQKFENFGPEPPAHVWEVVRSRIAGNPPTSGNTGFVMPMFIALSLLLFLGGLLYHFLGNNPSANILTSEAKGQFLHAPGTVTTDPSTVLNAAPSSEASATTPDNIPAEIPVREPFRKDNPARQTITAEPDQAYSGNNSPAATSRTGLWETGLHRKLASGDISYADAVNYNLSPRDIKKLNGYRDYARNNRASWSLGLYFHPEVTSFRENDLDNAISYGLAILPQINFNRFFIQSGVNIRSSHDKGNYAIDYNRFLGTYEHVYQITFDSTENGIIPTYYTQTMEVYDTIDHYAISETRVNYTYLEIPVLFGYRHTFGKISLYAKAGPAASFMIIKKLPEAIDPEDKARIINVDYQVPVRSTINWQLQLGAGLEYQLSDKLGFSLEPTFRFALDPEYDLPANAGAKSTTYGVRAGLKYNF